MTLEKLYAYRREYENDPDKRQRLGEWYVQEIERQIAEKEGKQKPGGASVNEEKIKAWVKAGRIIDVEYAAEHGITIADDGREHESIFGIGSALHEGESI